MLIFTYKLEKYIKKIILPKILLKPDKYIIKGSFRRKIPYITDIDIVNEVYPEINPSNIYEKIIDLLKKLQTEENNNIILFYITCGVDERFKINTGSDEELAKIRSLLDYDEVGQFDTIIQKYADNFDKKIFFVSEMIWKYYKLRWTPKNVLDDKMTLREGLEVNFSDIVKENTSLLLQYYVKIESYPIGIDVVINYKKLDMGNAYQAAADYQLKLANYSKEYYYMLFPFKYYFKENRNISQELEDLIEKKFGLYKQLMVRIDTYHTLYQTKNLDIRLATSIVSGIIKDTYQLPEFRSNSVKKIKEVAIDNPPNVKMEEWALLLDVLYDEINAAANSVSEKHFFKYLDMLPENIRNKYYFNIRRPKQRDDEKISHFKQKN